MKNLISLLIFFLVVSCSFQIYGQKNVSAETNEDKFLERFVGVWIGEGLSDGEKTRDEIKFEWRFGTRFLNFNYRTLEGRDDYASEGFLWFNGEKKLYEYYEFNNGRWAVRQGNGKKKENSLVISEKRKDAEIELIFEFVDSETMKITESYLRGKIKEPFVVYTFKRKPA